MKRNDELFGELQLVGDIIDKRSWDTSVSLPYFRSSGKNLDLDMSVRSDNPLDSEELFRKGRFLLSIDASYPAKVPTEGQRIAWKRVLQRGDALWDEVLKKMVEEYVRQRPARVDAWKRMFGRKELGRGLPEIKRFADMKKLVRPWMICMSKPDDPNEPAEIDVMFFSTWFNGIHVRIRDGHFFAFRRMVARGRPEDLPPQLHHRELGPLAWHEDKWYGIVQCAALRDFIQAASHRTKFLNEPDSYGGPDSTLSWDHARGEYPLHIKSAGKKSTTRRHVNVLKKFKSQEAANVTQILRTIFRQYTRSRDKLLDKNLWLYEEELPPLQSPEELADVIQLDSMNIASDGRSSPRLELNFDCTWDSCLRVIWRDGKELEIRNHANRKRRK